MFLIFTTGPVVYTTEKPSDIVDLSQWKLTLPYFKPGTKSAIEILQPELHDYQNAKCFFVNKADNSLVFRAHCTDTTTKSSKYPRCELREMQGGKLNNAKQKKAQWSTSDGKLHRMTLVQAITSVPNVKKHVVAGQIHDADDDVIMIRLEARKLFVERNKFGDVTLDQDYRLGSKFTIRIDAYDGFIKVWYNGVLKMEWEYARDKCYFKAGCYTQSNTSKGDKPESYGEVVIHKLVMEHTDMARLE
ncbi:MAG: polysaccharide lyase family 7 protein [Planctomycetes bacterium]|nr:polysaccharide lyase family 7 protein [Planctomycetota bacterium]